MYTRSSHRHQAVILAIAGLALTFFSFSVQAATFQLPAGTDVKVKFNADTKISSGSVAPGTKLAITLAEPIKIGDVLLVAAGASGSAEVKEVKKAKAPGKPGKIVVEFVDLGTRGGYKTVDGAPIKLGGRVEKAGKGKKLLAYVTIVGIFLIKGGQGELDANQVYTAKVAETIVLHSD